MQRLISIFILSFILFSTSAQGIKLLDSLELQLRKYNEVDSIRLNILIELSWELRNYNIISSFEYNQQALYLATLLKDKKKIAKIYNYRGVLYRNISDYPEAEKNFYEALRIAEEENILTEKGYAYNNLGDIMRLTGNTDKAIDYIFKANGVFIQNKDKKGEAYTYIRLSEAYQKAKNLEEAEKCARKSLEFRHFIKASPTDIAASLNRIGDILTLKKDYQVALTHYKEGLKISIEYNEGSGKITNMQDIAKVYIRIKRFVEADSILREALSMVKKFKNTEQEANIYEFMTELYEASGDKGRAYEFYKKRQVIKDSVYSNQRMLQINQMRVRYDAKNKDDENNKLKNRLQIEQLIRIGGFFIFLLVLGGAFWIYRNSRKINKFNKVLAHKNQEVSNVLKNLEHANNAIIKQSKEIEIRNKEIELRNEDFLNSVGYALLIQQAILPTRQVLKQLFEEYLVIWEPKDIISGDFYWVAQKGDKVIVALVDCTGHGVPGAMMSMLGNNLLNNIIHDKEIHYPDQILNLMHEGIINKLNKDANNVIDGMDIGIFTWDMKRQKIYYAGAGIPLYYVLLDNSVNIHVVEPDKISLGGMIIPKNSFVLHTLDVSSEMMLYMASDGFKDQFGGQQGKKLGTKRLKDLIMKTTHLPMKSQQEILAKELYTWQKASSEIQTDDITLFGVRISNRIK